MTRTNECGILCLDTNKRVCQYKKGEGDTNVLLKNKRESIHLTQEELSKLSKVSPRAYQNYEAGIRNPTVYVALRIAKALGVTVEELFSE